MGTYRLPGCLRCVWGVMSKVPTESVFVSSFSDGCMLLIQESPLSVYTKYWGLQNLCTKNAKSKKCKAFLIWHIKWLIIILWPRTQ